MLRDVADELEHADEAALQQTQKVGVQAGIVAAYTFHAWGDWGQLR
jgi:hypothetical protein